MGFQASNVMTKAFIMKFVELFFVFIVFLLFRVGRGGDVFYWGAGPQVPTVATTTTTTVTTTTTMVTTAITQSAGVRNFDDSEIELKYPGSFVYADPYVEPGMFLTLTERAENDLIFGILTSVGYLFITIVLMIGILMGDKQKYTMLLFNLFGFLFFISLGSEHINVYAKMSTGKSKAKGMGAMAIMTSFTFLVDTVFSVMEIMNGDGD